MTGLAIKKTDSLAKFKNENGEIDVEKLSKSYLELESSYSKLKSGDKDDSWIDSLTWDFDDEGHFPPEQKELLLEHLPERLVALVEPMLGAHINRMKSDAAAFKSKMDEKYGGLVGEMIEWASENWGGDTIETFNNAVADEKLAEPALERLYQDFSKATGKSAGVDVSSPVAGKITPDTKSKVEPFASPEDAVSAFTEASSNPMQTGLNKVLERMKVTPGLEDQLLGTPQQG